MGRKTRKRPAALSDQLRYLIEAGDLSRYEIAKQSGVDASQLHRFVKGKGRLTTDSLDKVGAALGLRFVQNTQLRHRL